VRLTQRNSNLPPEKRRRRGRGVVWRAYKWSSIGDILSSGRSWNDQIIEVFYTPLIYLIVAHLAFVFWLIQIAHRTKRSQPTNKNTIPIRRLTTDFLAASLGGVSGLVVDLQDTPREATKLPSKMAGFRIPADRKDRIVNATVAQEAK
jgi:hypothetical protein